MSQQEQYETWLAKQAAMGRTVPASGVQAKTQTDKGNKNG